MLAYMQDCVTFGLLWLYCSFGCWRAQNGSTNLLEYRKNSLGLVQRTVFCLPPMWCLAPNSIFPLFRCILKCNCMQVAECYYLLQLVVARLESTFTVSCWGILHVLLLYGMAKPHLPLIAFLLLSFVIFLFWKGIFLYGTEIEEHNPHSPLCCFFPRSFPCWNCCCCANLFNQLH